MAVVFPKIWDFVPIGSLVLVCVYVYTYVVEYISFLKRRVRRTFKTKKCRKLAICIQYIEAMKGMDMWVRKPKQKQ